MPRGGSPNVPALSEGRLVAWFSLALALLIALAVFSYRATLSAIESERSVRHSDQVLGELEQTLATLTDAETGQRGFLVTGSEDYLAPYTAAVGAVEEHRNRLRALVAGNPVQGRLLPVLESSIATKLSELEETVAVRRTRGLPAAQAIVLSGRGKVSMDQIRGVVAAMKSEEESARQRRSAESDVSVRLARLVLLASGLVAVAIFALFFYQVRRSLRHRVALFAREQEARREAEQANRLKDEFLATVSHELRTPLNAVLGWARMLREGTLDAKASARGLDAIERNARVQAQLVEDLLDVSRIISGKLRLDPRPADLAGIVESALDVVRPSAEARAITLATVLDPAAGVITGDADRLQQVVWNLLSNAVKFTGKGGRVDVRLQRVDSQLELTVRDDGQGIAPEFLPHVFELFRQADASSTRGQMGLGIGLAIARRIVEMHGGTIRASSAGLGAGATFTVSLPVRAIHEAPKASEVPAARGPASLRGIRILVADDQPDGRELVRAALSQCGAEVRTVDSARGALEAVEAWRPDVLVSDIGMPGEDGYALIRQIRGLPADKGGLTLAVALTAYARVEDRMKTLAAGFQMHVPKPVEPSELVAIVESLVGGAPNAAAGPTGPVLVSPIDP
jgi:signal transduction histidine kinase/ActR/RegA family two-component response regulator